MRKGVYYLAHPRVQREEVRKWEKGFERRTGIELVNPFYDHEGADKERNDLGKEKYDLIENPWDIVRGDLSAIADPKCDGVIALIDSKDSWGTPMEMRAAHAEYGKSVYSVVTNGDHNHPWLRAHSDKVFRTRDALENYLVDLWRDADVLTRVFSRNPKTVRFKQEAYALFLGGFFGNKPQTWENYSRLMEDDFRGKVSIRSRAGMGRSRVQYGVPTENVSEIVDGLMKGGICRDDLTFNESMPDEHLTIQGEVTRAPAGLWLHYSTAKDRMNTALAEAPKHANGFTAQQLLKDGMIGRDYMHLMDLMSEYPNDVVEFSSYSVPVGEEKTNSVIWEVRGF
ncbi:hypothetical protein HOA55_01110 [archaeon]|jgi:hypothetical protein|nr:hypothetical protein [archaeon]